MDTQTIHIKEGEQKIIPLVWFGDEDRTLSARVILDKPDSSVKVLCIFFGKAHTLKAETEVIHRAPNTFSRTLVKGVVDGTAIADFEGRVVIEKGAKGADADLNEHAIVLSSGARANAIPRLEVMENEVKAGHGATVGKVGEEELFYLATRGLPRDEAKRLIVHGFLESFVGEFPPKEAEEIRTALSKI